jgi:hypothetical protein
LLFTQLTEVKTMATSNAQKSEVHATTGDAVGSPVAAGDQETTRQQQAYPGRMAGDQPKRPLDPLPQGTQIVRDDTDAGGPLVVKSEDSDLNPPRVTKDPFPTERKPEIDPPVK